MRVIRRCNAPGTAEMATATAFLPATLADSWHRTCRSCCLDVSAGWAAGAPTAVKGVSWHTRCTAVTAARVSARANATVLLAVDLYSHKQFGTNVAALL